MYAVFDLNAGQRLLDAVELSVFPYSVASQPSSDHYARLSPLDQDNIDAIEDAKLKKK